MTLSQDPLQYFVKPVQMLGVMEIKGVTEFHIGGDVM